MSEIRILICDDHPVVRQGIRWLVETECDMKIVGEASDGAQALAMAGELRPDVILMDLLMPGRDGLWAVREIIKSMPDARILILTSFAEDERVVEAVKSGALGYLLKDSSPAELIAAIRELAAGGSPIPPQIARRLVRGLTAAKPQPVDEGELTERENEVLVLIAEGLSNQEIADRLVVSERTVRCHVSSILHKLHLSSRTQAALYAVRRLPRSRREAIAAALSDKPLGHWHGQGKAGVQSFVRSISVPCADGGPGCGKDT